jgi:hypothetical protein
MRNSVMISFLQNKGTGVVDCKTESMALSPGERVSCDGAFISRRGMGKGSRAS